ncbi:MAG: hypothetical protein WD069_03760 [Planctomycetales bacterium]
MKPRVLITVPNGSGWIHKHVAFALLRMAQDARVAATIQLPTHAPYVQNLHLCRREFLAGPFDYWLTLDDDNPPRRNPLDLALLDLDVVGCPTPVWANICPGDFPVYWNAMDEVRDERGEVGFRPHQPCEGLQEVDAVGSGCLVIARRVMEAVPAPFFREWDAEGLVRMGGDFAFCRRARAAGFHVFAHFDYPCHHFNEIEIGEVVEAFGRVSATSQSYL